MLPVPLYEAWWERVREHRRTGTPIDRTEVREAIDDVIKSEMELSGRSREHVAARLNITAADYFNLLIRVIDVHSGDVGRPCGYDVNDMILKYPPDGKHYEEKCPRCGNRIDFITAVYPD